MRFRLKRKADNSENNSDSDDSRDADTTVHKSKKKRSARRKNINCQPWKKGMNVLKINYLPCVKGMVTNTQWFSVACGQSSLIMENIGELYL